MLFSSCFLYFKLVPLLSFGCPVCRILSWLSVYLDDTIDVVDFDPVIFRSPWYLICELELLFHATSNAPPAPIRIYVCDMLVEIGFSTKNMYDSRANSHHVPPITISKWLPRKHN